MRATYPDHIIMMMMMMMMIIIMTIQGEAEKRAIIKQQLIQTPYIGKHSVSINHSFCNSLFLCRTLYGMSVLPHRLQTQL